MRSGQLIPDKVKSKVRGVPPLTEIPSGKKFAKFGASANNSHCDGDAPSQMRIIRNNSHLRRRIAGANANYFSKIRRHYLYLKFPVKQSAEMGEWSEA